MNERGKAIGKDYGLTIRMIFTGFLLALTYVALFGVLLFTGLPFELVMIMGIGMVFFQYFFSDKLVLKTTGARVVTSTEEPKLHEIIERLSVEARIPKPKNIAIMEVEVPNAFATGRSPKQATVAVTRGLLNRLNEEELEAVLGHELAHVKNRVLQ